MSVGSWMLVIGPHFQVGSATFVERWSRRPSCPVHASYWQGTASQVISNISAVSDVTTLNTSRLSFGPYHISGGEFYRAFVVLPLLCSLVDWSHSFHHLQCVIIDLYYQCQL
jgi:hypothetical protein